MNTQPDASFLCGCAGISSPVLGLYDAPEPEAFEPLVRVSGSACLFSAFPDWLDGRTLLLTRERAGCGGCGHWLFGIRSRSRKEYLDFLVGGEGLKADRELMGAWIDSLTPYRTEHGNILVGPLKAELYPYLKTVTFVVNPDQLSLLMLGAEYHSGPDDPASVIAPFGSGCMLLGPVFPDLNEPRAVIGSTDIAMRQYLPPETMLFTVTRPMFERLCTLDDHSFLGKPFWRNLRRSREQQD
jgi:hypothetical protein